MTSTVLVETGFVPKSEKLKGFNDRKPALNKKIRTLDDASQRIAVVDLNPDLYSIGDGTHYNSSSTRALGIALAQAMDPMAYGQTEFSQNYGTDDEPVTRKSFYQHRLAEYKKLLQGKLDPVYDEEYCEATTQP
ncbi:MAG: hypothetical protein ACPGKS_07975 [Coraliomargarita sp.]